MRLFLWIAGIAFAITALPAVFYFVLYILRGDDVLRDRARKFYGWASTIFLLALNLGIYGHIARVLLEIWGFIKIAAPAVPG